jgi:hypothetical protein
MIIWKGSEDKYSLYNLRCSPGMCFERRRKSTKTVGEDNRCLDRVLKPRNPVHLTSGLSARSARFCPCNRSNYFHSLFHDSFSICVCFSSTYRHISSKYSSEEGGISLRYVAD